MHCVVPRNRTHPLPRTCNGHLRRLQGSVVSGVKSPIEKTRGIVPMLQEQVGKLGKRIRWSFIYGSLARGEEGAGSDVDLIVIANVSTLEMAPVLRRLEKTVNCQINQRSLRRTILRSHRR